MTDQKAQRALDAHIAWLARMYRGEGATVNWATVPVVAPDFSCITVYVTLRFAGGSSRQEWMGSGDSESDAIQDAAQRLREFDEVI